MSRAAKPRNPAKLVPVPADMQARLDAANTELTVAREELARLSALEVEARKRRAAACDEISRHLRAGDADLPTVVDSKGNTHVVLSVKDEALTTRRPGDTEKRRWTKLYGGDFQPKDRGPVYGRPSIKASDVDAALAGKEAT